MSRWFLAVFLLHLIAPLCCKAQERSSRGDWNIAMIEGRRYVPVLDVARFYRFKPTFGANGTFQLLGGERTVRGKAGTQEVTIDNVKYVLCFPIRLHNDAPYISAMDVTKIIEPVLRPGKIANATVVRTVILDAGHGGHDPGAVGRLGREKDYTLDVARRAKILLEQRGFEVKLTRTGDYFVPLENRSAFANRHRNAVFISIHFNKSKTGGGTGTGIETFCLAPRGVPSMDEESVTVNAMKAYPGHARDAENVLLATLIHASLLRYCPLPDRGIKRARFHVIRETAIPAVLVEGGFLDHPNDLRMVASPVFRQRIAMAVVEGVQRFQQAVKGRPFLPAPTLVASGADPTSAPSLRDPIALPPDTSTRFATSPSDPSAPQVELPRTLLPVNLLLPEAPTEKSLALKVEHPPHSVYSVYSLPPAFERNAQLYHDFLRKAGHDEP